MRFEAVTLGDLIAGGKRLEFGCFMCRLHLYVDGSALALPGSTALPDICDLLRCPQCGAENAEPGHPVWARPDARPPRMGSGPCLASATNE